MQDRMELAARYRARAATVRKIAEMVLDSVEREQLLAIARDYEYLARDAETKALARGALDSFAALRAARAHQPKFLETKFDLAERRIQRGKLCIGPRRPEFPNCTEVQLVKESKSRLSCEFFQRPKQQPVLVKAGLPQIAGLGVS